MGRVGPKLFSQIYRVCGVHPLHIYSQILNPIRVTSLPLLVEIQFYILVLSTWPEAVCFVFLGLSFEVFPLCAQGVELQGD
jgi:hypothetical protein